MASTTFDWVGAHAKCTLEALFKELQTQVEKDASQAKELLGLDVTFEPSSDDGTWFAVHVPHPNAVVHVGTNVGFRLDKPNRRIRVFENGDKEVLTLSAAMDEDTYGPRYLVCMGRESDDFQLPAWRVSEYVLKDLIFPPA